MRKRSMAMVLACAALLAAPAAHGVEQIIGDVDGFGFSDPANGWDLSALQKAGGGPADTNGDGILTEGEAIPDLNGNGSTAIGSGDDFDNRSAAEKADAAGRGEKWTDVSLLGGASSVQPPITPPGTPADPVFVFRFPVPSPDDPDFGLDHLLNIVAADFDAPPFTITVDGKDVAGAALGPGIPDGGITVTIVNVPWTDMLDGEVVVEFKKMVNEPFIAIDYLRLSTHAGEAGARCGDGDLTTGIDDNGDGRDDHWVVFRPDGVATLPNVIDPPFTAWRGGASQSPRGPFLGNDPQPVLGTGRWVDGGGTLDAQGMPQDDAVGVYTYRCTFDLAGLRAFSLMGEWAADNQLREIRINGVPVPGIGCACNPPYVDNRTGQLVDAASEFDNFQQIHRFEITDQALFRFDVDANGEALNTIEIDVYNAGAIVGLLLTGGPGTSVPGGAGKALGVPIYNDTLRNWSDTLPLQPTAGAAAASESFAVVELTDDNRRLLLDALERAGAVLQRHEPATGTPGGLLHPLNMRGRFLYLYQAENDVPCLKLLQFSQRGAFHNVGLVVPAAGGQSNFVLRDGGDGEPLDPASRRVEFVASGGFLGGAATLPAPGGTLVFEPAGDVARDCNGQQPVASAIYWGLSDQPPALTAHVATWSGIDPQTGQPVTGRHETLQAGSNSPPVPRCVGEFTLALGADGTAVLDAAKLDAGSFDVDGTIVQTAVSRTTFSCPDLGDQTVRFTVTDDDGASASCDVLVHVVDTQAPALTLPADVTIECDRERFEATIAPERTGSATATDNCDAQSAGCQRQAAATGGNQARTRAQDVATGSTTTTATGSGAQGIVGKGSPSTIAASTNPALVASSPAPSGCGVQLSYSDRMVSEACPIVIERTWTATDPAGNQTSGVQTITVVDTSPPVIALPKPITIGCGDPVDPDFTGRATATDSCDPSPTLRYEDTEESVAVDPGATGPVVYRRIVRTWIATDACGNEARQVQTIEIQDAAPPAPVCVGSLTLELGPDGAVTLAPEQLADGPLGAMDDCGVAAATLSRSRFTGTDVPMRDPASVTLTLTDVAGRTGSCLTQLTVIDRLPPVIERCVPARTIESAAACRALAPDLAAELVASDNDHIASITQDPAPGTALGAGEYVFTFTVTDDSGNETSCSTLVRVIDPPPIALADHYAVDEDGTLAVDAKRGLLVNDTDPAQQANAAPTLTAAAGPDAPAHGSVTVEADGAFTYTPDPDYFGTDRFTYRVTDACGQSAIGEVTIEVRPVQDPPTAVDDRFAVLEDSASNALAVLANDTDAPDRGETLSVAGFTAPAHGRLTLAADVLYYTPASDFSGTDSFTYTISDGHGGEAQASVTIEVQPVNDPPRAVADAYATDEDVTLTVGPNTGVLANDRDPDAYPAALTALLRAAPAHGQLALASDGGFRYTPEPDFHGTDRFRYAATDGEATTAEVEVTIEVRPVNDAPVATGDAYGGLEDERLVVPAPGLLANDADRDGDPLTARVVEAPASGTLTLQGDGGFVYEPPANFSGSLTFRYRVTDGQAESEPATVTLTLAEVNDPPVAVDDALTVLEDSVLNQVRVLANDHSGPDASETLRVVRAGPAQHGSVGLIPDGRLVVYTPDPDFHGTDSFPYVVSDGRGGLAEGQVQIEVLPVDDPPVFDPAGPFEVDEGDTLSFSVLARDVDGDTLAYEALELPDGASFDPATRTVRWRPDYEQAGTYVLRLRACDGGERTDLGSEQLSIVVDGGPGGDEVARGELALPTDLVLCDELEVTVIVHDVNRPPSIVEAASAGVATNLPPLVQGAVLRVHEEEVLEAELFGIDPDGDPVQLAALQLPEGARFDPERRVLTWRPRFGDRGSYVVGLAATDGQASDFANVRIEVLPSQRLRGGAAGCSFGGGARGPASASWALVLGALAVWFGLRRRLGRRCAG